MLRRNGTESLFPRRRGQDCNDGAATQERIAASKGLLLESSGSFGYDRGLKSDNWEIPVVMIAASSPETDRAWPS